MNLINVRDKVSDYNILGRLITNISYNDTNINFEKDLDIEQIKIAPTSPPNCQSKSLKDEAELEFNKTYCIIICTKDKKIDSSKIQLKTGYKNLNDSFTKYDGNYKDEKFIHGKKTIYQHFQSNIYKVSEIEGDYGENETLQNGTMKLYIAERNQENNEWTILAHQSDLSGNFENNLLQNGEIIDYYYDENSKLINLTVSNGQFLNETLINGIHTTYNVLDVGMKQIMSIDTIKDDHRVVLVSYFYENNKLINISEEKGTFENTQLLEGTYKYFNVVKNGKQQLITYKIGNFIEFNLTNGCKIHYTYNDNNELTDIYKYKGKFINGDLNNGTFKHFKILNNNISNEQLLVEETGTFVKLFRNIRKKIYYIYNNENNLTHIDEYDGEFLNGDFIKGTIKSFTVTNGDLLNTKLEEERQII